MTSNNKVVILDGRFQPYASGNPLPNNIIGADGNTATVGSNSSLDVNISDQTSEIIDLHLTQLIQAVTIITNTAVDDTVITISSAAEPTDGNLICLKEGEAFYQGKILSHAANAANWDVTLDTPLDYAYTTVGGCSERNTNMNVNGSVTPAVFTVSPSNLLAGTRWDIVRMLISITDGTSMDDGKFGGITALTKGVVFRKADGLNKNIFNAKTNGELAAHMYDVTYISNAVGPSGLYGLRGRRTFGGFGGGNGAVIRLSEATNDEFQCIIQDDLTGLSSFEVVIQGHVVKD